MNRVVVIGVPSQAGLPALALVAAPGAHAADRLFEVDLADGGGCSQLDTGHFGVALEGGLGAGRHRYGFAVLCDRQRVVIDTVDAKLEMQMRPGGPAGGADGADFFTLLGAT